MIVASPATLVQLGNLRDPNTLLAIFGLLVTAILHARGIRAAIIVGILLTTVTGAVFGLIQWTPQSYSFADLSATMGQLDIAAASKLGLLEVVFVFLFVDVFDNVGTLVGVTKKAGLVTTTHIPRIRRILIADSAATIAGAFAGTSTVVSYIESASGVRRGWTHRRHCYRYGPSLHRRVVRRALCGAVPQAATAPALIVVGSLMMSHAGEIPWSNAGRRHPRIPHYPDDPADIQHRDWLIVRIYSVRAAKTRAWRIHKDDWLVYLLAALFIARFVYLGRA